MARQSKSRRHEVILRRAQSDVTVRISELAEAFSVTAETIRRDLDELAMAGLLTRTYGGASMRSLNAEPGLEVRRQTLIDERRRIARAATALVDAGDVLMIDAGSTTVHFAEELAGFGSELTILTNCLPVARLLGHNELFDVILCPGKLRTTEDAVYGYETLDFLDRFHATKAFIGASGVSVEGVSDVDLRASWVKRRMIERAGQTVLMADASKFGENLFRTVCELESIDHLVTDRVPPETLAKPLAAKAVNVHVTMADLSQGIENTP